MRGVRTERDRSKGDGMEGWTRSEERRRSVIGSNVISLLSMGR